MSDKSPCEIVEAVKSDLTVRAQHGLAKYGMTVAANPLLPEQWVQHAYEEAMDLAVYLRRLKDEVLIEKARLLNRLARAHEMLARVEAQFASYGAQHAAKGTSEGDAKARVNFGLVAEISMLRATEAPEQRRVPDDIAVDDFAQAMKRKMAWGRAKGRDGWSTDACTREHLASMFVRCCLKSNENNFVDIANLAMMLHTKGATDEVAAVLRKEATP